MLSRLGRLTARRPLAVVLAWLVLAVLGYLLAATSVTGASLFDRLGSGETAVPGSPSAVGAARLAQDATSGGDVTLLVDGVAPGEADTVALSTARARLTGLPGVARILDPVTLASHGEDAAAGHLTARGGDGFVVIVTLRPGLDDAQQASTEHVVGSRLQALGARLVVGEPGATATVGSDTLVNEAITRRAGQDLEIGVLVALPLALLVMVLVFGSLLTAAVPVAGALASVGAGLGTIVGLSHLLALHVTVVDAVACLGLGLTIDYSLLLVSRFREELAQHQAGSGEEPSRRRAGHEVADALVRTVTSAGRTVTFSALTVAASLAGLLVFAVPSLRSVGVAGIGVVVVALVTSLTLVPALLRLLGARTTRSLGSRSPGSWLARLLRRTADVTNDDGPLARLTRRVARRPWWVLLGSVLALVVLALPLAGMTMRTSGVELLPTSSHQRAFLTTLTRDYPATVAPQVQVLVEGSTTVADGLAARVRELPGVERVDGPATVGTGNLLRVHVTGGDPGGPVATRVVQEVRDLPASVPVWTVGQAAEQVDTAHALREGLWWAVLIVVLATIVVLFAMTGSLVVPIQALVTNGLSLAAALGMLTWVFQDSARAAWLHATSTGGIETSVVAIVTAFAFGIAMDYEVFLLARVAELRAVHGLALPDALARGTQRSGRIITSAAAILVVVFAGFATGQILVIEQVGFALAVAVLLDATVVRLLLVPALMTVLGPRVLWAPAPLVRLRDRLLGRAVAGPGRR